MNVKKHLKQRIKHLKQEKEGLGHGVLRYVVILGIIEELEQLIYKL